MRLVMPSPNLKHLREIVLQESPCISHEAESLPSSTFSLSTHCQPLVYMHTVDVHAQAVYPECCCYPLYNGYTPSVLASFPDARKIEFFEHLGTRLLLSVLAVFHSVIFQPHLGASWLPCCTKILQSGCTCINTHTLEEHAHTICVSTPIIQTRFSLIKQSTFCTHTT